MVQGLNSSNYTAIFNQNFYTLRHRIFAAIACLYAYKYHHRSPFKTRTFQLLFYAIHKNTHTLTHSLTHHLNTHVILSLWKSIHLFHITVEILHFILHINSVLIPKNHFLWKWMHKDAHFYQHSSILFLYSHTVKFSSNSH